MTIKAKRIIILSRPFYGLDSMSSLNYPRRGRSAQPSATRETAPAPLDWRNDASTLQFAIWFAQASADEAIEARDSALQFAQAAEEGHDLRAKDVLALQSETLALIQSAAEPGSITEIVLRVPFAITRPGSKRRPGDRARVLPIRDAMSIRDRFLYRLVRLLEHVGVEKLSRCEAPRAWAKNDGERCGRVFLRVTSKAFCSQKCQSRTYMRGYIPRGAIDHGKSARTRRR